MNFCSCHPQPSFSFSRPKNFATSAKRDSGGQHPSVPLPITITDLTYNGEGQSEGCLELPIQGREAAGTSHKLKAIPVHLNARGSTDSSALSTSPEADANDLAVEFQGGQACFFDQPQDSFTSCPLTWSVDVLKAWLRTYDVPDHILERCCVSGKQFLLGGSKLFQLLGLDDPGSLSRLQWLQVLLKQRQQHTCAAQPCWESHSEASSVAEKFDSARWWSTRPADSEEGLTASCRMHSSKAAKLIAINTLSKTRKWHSCIALPPRSSAPQQLNDMDTRPFKTMASRPLALSDSSQCADPNSFPSLREAALSDDPPYNPNSCLRRSHSHDDLPSCRAGRLGDNGEAIVPCLCFPFLPWFAADYLITKVCWKQSCSCLLSSSKMLEQEQDMSHPLNEYFISSSHNTFLEDTQVALCVEYTLLLNRPTVHGNFKCRAVCSGAAGRNQMC